MRSSNIVRRFVTLALAVLIASSLSACKKGKNPNPIAPGPTSGTVTIVYRPDTCINAPVSDLFCNRTAIPIQVTAGEEWGSYRFRSVEMFKQADGSYAMTATAPASSTVPGKRLTIHVVDAGLCDRTQQKCVDPYTGRNITVNGVRLNDGAVSTSFGYVPPDEVQK